MTGAITSKTGQSTTHISGHVIGLPLGTEKRERSKTPLEELASDDEQQYVMVERDDVRERL